MTKNSEINESQRAMVGQALLEPYEKEAKQRQVEAGKQYGENHPKQEVTENLPEPLQKCEAAQEVAKIVNVSPRLVRDAKEDGSNTA